MNIRFELPQDMEQQLLKGGVDPDREAKEVYLMERYRQAKITHRQLQEALDLGFHETEQLLKQRGLGDMKRRDLSGNRHGKSLRRHKRKS